MFYTKVAFERLGFVLYISFLDHFPQSGENSIDRHGTLQIKKKKEETCLHSTYDYFSFSANIKRTIKLNILKKSFERYIFYVPL